MTLRLGLIGFPVEHSLSPSFQQPALDALGIDATYELWPTPLEELEQRVATLRDETVLGANVTVPHKQAVIPFLDQLSDIAARAEAVNTIINRNGKLHGDNTDVFGLARSLTDAGVNQVEFRAVVLGAGGAARGAVLAIESLGASLITIANRTPSRAEALAATVPGVAVEITGLESSALLESMQAADLVINATSLGWKADEMPVSPAAFTQLPKDCLVVDLTYRDTAFLEAAKQHQLRTLDGLPMLVYQGAKSLELWTDRPVPVDLMMQCAQQARPARA
jgi:shikimate dehydrogenase